jgi:hypothetical protein
MTRAMLLHNTLLSAERSSGAGEGIPGNLRLIANQADSAASVV